MTAPNEWLWRCQGTKGNVIIYIQCKCAICYLHGSFHWKCSCGFWISYIIRIILYLSCVPIVHFSIKNFNQMPVNLFELWPKLICNVMGNHMWIQIVYFDAIARCSFFFVSPFFVLPLGTWHRYRHHLWWFDSCFNLF